MLSDINLSEELSSFTESQVTEVFNHLVKRDYFPKVKDLLISNIMDHLGDHNSELLEAEIYRNMATSTRLLPDRIPSLRVNWESLEDPQKFSDIFRQTLRLDLPNGLSMHTIENFEHRSPEWVSRFLEQFNIVLPGDIMSDST